MEKIEGVELKAELQKTVESLLEDRKSKLRNKIASIIGLRSEAAGTVTKLKKDLAKAEAAVKKHQDRLDAIESGRWDVIDESEAGSKPATSEPAQA